jgi:4-hydroxybenzoate polyprenyltransferase
MLARSVASMSAHTDIDRSGWVGCLPQSWVPYVLLARLDRIIGAWLLFLPGLWSLLLARQPLGQTVWLVTLFGLGSVMMRAAGCVVNDMWDRDLDRRVSRTAGRPLAAGMIRMRHATYFLGALLLASLLILLQLNLTAEALGVASLGLVASYPLAKRFTWWPQLMLGFTFGWGAPMGYAAARGHLDFAAAALYGAVILWILGYDTIYAHQDREDDALAGMKSTARLFAANSRPFLAVCYGATILLLAVAGQQAGLSGWFFAGLLPTAALLAWQVATLDIDDPRHCLKLFKLNRLVGLVVALALIAGRF